MPVQAESVGEEQKAGDLVTGLCSGTEVYLGDGRTMRRFKTRDSDRIFIRRHIAAYKTFTTDIETVRRQVIRQALAIGIMRRSIAEIMNTPGWIVDNIADHGRKSLNEAQRAAETCRHLRGMLVAAEEKQRRAEAKAAEYGHFLTAGDL